MAAVDDPNPADDLLRGALQEADSTYKEEKRKVQDKSGRGARPAAPAPREITLHDALQEIEDSRAEEKRRQAELAGMTWWQQFLSRFRR